MSVKMTYYRYGVKREVERDTFEEAAREAYQLHEWEQGWVEKIETPQKTWSSSNLLEYYGEHFEED